MISFHIGIVHVGVGHKLLNELPRHDFGLLGCGLSLIYRYRTDPVHCGLQILGEFAPLRRHRALGGHLQFADNFANSIAAVLFPCVQTGKQQLNLLLRLPGGTHPDQRLVECYIDGAPGLLLEMQGISANSS
jgi:hypothetical protein